eukprot:scaffold12152_cov52-Cyclotella_meneghiniana.AAC.5
MITFDNTESISRVIDGHLEDDEYWGRESIFYCPKFAALTLIFMLEKSLGFVEGVLPDLCSETLALCAVLRFLVSPSIGHLDAIINTQKSYELPLHLNPESLIEFILINGSSSNGDLEFQFEHSCHHKWPKIPFLMPRVEIALKYKKIDEAVALCMEKNSADFWNQFTTSNPRIISKDAIWLARELVQTCLSTIKSAVTLVHQLPEDFFCFSLHVIFSMNWYGSCKKCSPTSALTEDAHSFLVRMENISLLHEVANIHAISDHYYGSMDFFFSSIRCLSRCVDLCEENHLYKHKKECKYCFMLSRIDEDVNTITYSHVPQTTKKRKRPSHKTPKDISSLEEIESIILKLQLKEPLSWVKDALKRIEDESNKR